MDAHFCKGNVQRAGISESLQKVKRSYSGTKGESNCG